MGFKVSELSVEERAKLVDHLTALHLEPSLLGREWVGPKDHIPQVALHRASVDLITDPDNLLREVQLFQRDGQDWVKPDVRGLSLLLPLDTTNSHCFPTECPSWTAEDCTCILVKRGLQIPECLRLIQDEVLLALHPLSREDELAGRVTRYFSALHVAVQPRYAVTLQQFRDAIQQLTNHHEPCPRSLGVAGLICPEPEYPDPVTKQLAVCFAALEHLLLTADSPAVALKAALTYHHVRGGALYLGNVLADVSSSRALATALDSYPEQPDAMANDFANSAKMMLANVLGYSPIYIDNSSLSEDEDSQLCSHPIEE